MYGMCVRNHASSNVRVTGVATASLLLYFQIDAPRAEGVLVIPCILIIILPIRGYLMLVMIQ